MKKILPPIFVVIIFLLGFTLRLKGISSSQSFWADEAAISSYARDIVMGKSSIPVGIMRVYYEPFQTGIIALFFKLFGISEFAARLPSVIFGTIGILFAYLLTSRLSNKWGGLLASFLVAFSQLNLANSTQAKPYIILQTMLFVICYLLALLRVRSGLIVKSNSFKNHLLILFILIFATLVHLIAVLFWIPYGIFIFILVIRNWRKIVKRPFILVGGLSVILVLGYLFNVHQLISHLFISQNHKIFFLFNNTMYLKNLLIRQYGIFFIPALLSFVFLWKKYKEFVLSIFGWLIAILFFWNFRSYSHNIRYLVPLFGIIFVLFGVFWAKVGEITLKNVKMLPCFIVTLILVITQYKIYFPLTTNYSLLPSYYSPNSDLYGDVQIADYKTMYAKIKKKIPNYQHIVIFNDVNDAQRWYLDKQADAYFIKGTTIPYKNGIDGKIVYGSLGDFLTEKSKYQKGILIVEDWESLLPEDIKQYAKKNMKLEFRVDGLKEAPGDPWPLEVYSWGLEANNSLK